MESKKELKLGPKDQALNITEQERRQIGAAYATEVENLEQEMERRLAELENDMAAFNSDKRLRALEEAAGAMEEDPNPTAVLNSGATARVAAKKDNEALIETGLQSDKGFLLPTSQEVEATEVL